MRVNKNWVNGQLKRLLDKNADTFKYTSYDVSSVKPKKDNIGKIRICVRVHNYNDTDDIIIEGVEGVINSFFGKYNPVIERDFVDYNSHYYKHRGYRFYVIMDKHPEFETLSNKESIMEIDEKIKKTETVLHDLIIERDRLAKIILEENNR